MNFAGWQWLLSIALDMLIKISLITYLGALITSTAASGFLLMAVVQSLFHFGCLLVGFTFVVALELVHLQPSRGVRFPIAVIVGNAVFVMLDAAFFFSAEQWTFLAAVLDVIAAESVSGDNKSSSDPDRCRG